MDNTKVLIYTDLHCSYNSSILPLYSDKYSNVDNDEKFTVRLNMIINTGKWLADLAQVNNVDCIINGGDTFDSTIVKAEELEAISRFFSFFEGLGVPHYVLVGNHEKVNEKFNASEFLSGYENVLVVDEPTCLGDDSVSLLPYVESDDITESLIKKLSNKFLVSHIDIKGSLLRENVVSETGTKPELLAKNFDFVANGHLHTAQQVKDNVWNIGSVSSISFGDNQEYIPSAVIYDTDTNTFKRIENPYTILFRRLTVSSPEGLKGQLEYLDRRFKYALNVKYDDYENKSEIQKILDEDDNVLVYKTISVFATGIEQEQEKQEDSCLADLDVKQKFKEFLNTVECKYDKDIYYEILDRGTPNE